MLNKEIINDLQNNFPEIVFSENESMSRHTTFKIGGNADVYVEPPVSQVVPLIKYLKTANIPYMVMGNGSNLLVSDAGVDGVVVSMGRNAGSIEIDGNKIHVEAGAMLSTVANTAAENGLAGMEFASGIPGSIGGAVYMNAGAYGVEIKDILVSAKVLTEDGQIVTMTAQNLDLSYRHSVLMETGGIVLSAIFALQQGNVDEIKAKISEIREQRVAKQPLNFPSAGSTFKRPTGYFAGKLIDDVGLRGYRVGGAQVSEKHCGFVVNTGDATCADVLQLMSDVDEKVFNKYQVHLEPEVRIIGRDIN